MIALYALHLLAGCSSPEPPAPVAPVPGVQATSLPTPPTPADLTTVFEVAPGPDPATSDIGAQRFRVSDGGLVWSEKTLLPVSTSRYGERRPVAVGDGEGGLIAVFEAEVPDGPLKGDVDIMAQRVGPDGTLRWGGGDRSLVVAATAAVEASPRLLADGRGGAFLVFERLGRDEGGRLDADLSAQHLAADGSATWGAGDPAGLSIAAGPGIVSGAVVAADGAGGLIVAFVEEPVEGERAGITRILGQRLDPGGAPLWGQGSRPLVIASSASPLSAPCLVPDGRGGALVIFQEQGSEADKPGDMDIMVQRVAGDGSLPWSDAPTAYKVVSATTLAETAVVAVPDGQGGAVVAFEGRWIAGERRGDVDLLAQRIDATGVGRWGEGAPVPLAYSDWLERAPALVPDGAGGAIAVFEQHPPASHLSTDVDLGAQRILADGTLAWHEGTASMPVSASSHAEQRPVAVPDGEGGVVVVFDARAREGEHAGDVEIVAQRLGADGTPRWGAGGESVLLAFTEALEQRPVVAWP
ncbi:MAG: hypothetical protein ABIO70_03560 [Pseudomonadota bacterium]